MRKFECQLFPRAVSCKWCSCWLSFQSDIDVFSVPQCGHIDVFSAPQSGHIDVFGKTQSGHIDVFGKTQSGHIDTFAGTQFGYIDVFSAPCSTSISAVSAYFELN